MSNDREDKPAKPRIQRIRLHDNASGDSTDGHESKVGNNDDEKVGYGKPPKAHQFKPGQSGNPSGRPKKRKDEATLTRELLDRIVTITERGKVKRIRMIEALIRRVLEDALKGNIKNVKLLFALYNAASTNQSIEDLTEDDKAVLAVYESQLFADRSGKVASDDR
ncbi:DUF5681 domain-containing protein [Bradyrhizobium sp. BR 10289]|uniref:DUF5681 domain-containing protein n=1 Tax=Bradyrhizobium sp. BR 10289 TaxID=2749993 RepID=UPI001C64CD36|nr:DUF5681 domain-containing protein [Bradyrhizobium sp. BR 10289]MBW7974495.1 hypothetical protein [Bradyrhizobium sp. BR 10289]